VRLIANIITRSLVNNKGGKNSLGILSLLMGIFFIVVATRGLIRNEQNPEIKKIVGKLGAMEPGFVGMFGVALIIIGLVKIFTP